MLCHRVGLLTLKPDTALGGATQFDQLARSYGAVRSVGVYTEGGAHGLVFISGVKASYPVQCRTPECATLEGRSTAQWG